MKGFPLFKKKTPKKRAESPPRARPVSRAPAPAPRPPPQQQQQSRQQQQYHHTMQQQQQPQQMMMVCFVDRILSYPSMLSSQNLSLFATDLVVYLQ